MRGVLRPGAHQRLHRPHLRLRQRPALRRRLGHPLLCDDPRGVCVQCRTDVDRAGNPAGGQCVNNRCEACDPGDQAGCLRTSLPATPAGGPSARKPTSTRASASCNNDCDPWPPTAATSAACQCGNNPPCAGGTPVRDDAAGACVEAHRRPLQRPRARQPVRRQPLPAL
ncbi:MAG: hypothetical protein R3F43_28025 [bacterium]